MEAKGEVSEHEAGRIALHLSTDPSQAVVRKIRRLRLSVFDDYRLAWMDRALKPRKDAEVYIVEVDGPYRIYGVSSTRIRRLEDPDQTQAVLEDVRLKHAEAEHKNWLVDRFHAVLDVRDGQVLFSGAGGLDDLLQPPMSP